MTIMPLTLDLLMRFLHLTGAAVGIGGLLVAATLLSKLSGDARAIAARQVGKWIGIGLTVAVIAGFYNMWRALHIHSDPRYIQILMSKATLGIFVFLFSIFVFHPAAFFKPFAERRAGWSLALLIASLLVVLMGNTLHTFYVPRDPASAQLLPAPPR
jgi:hypothetical protein